MRTLAFSRTPEVVTVVLAAACLVAGVGFSSPPALARLPVARLGAGDRPDVLPRPVPFTDATPGAPGGDASPAAVPAPAPQPDIPVAWLTVPSLHLADVAIYDRGLDSHRQMLIAPGFAVTHYAFSGALAGGSNAVLYGHDDIEGGVFGHIMSLNTGDAIVIRTAATTYRYRVSQPPRLVKPDAVSILDPTPTSQLTLFSCWPLWVDDQRAVVVAGPA